MYSVIVFQFPNLTSEFLDAGNKKLRESCSTQLEQPSGMLYVVTCYPHIVILIVLFDLHFLVSVYTMLFCPIPGVCKI